ncbi:NB-ARC domain-containing protein [Aerosakkonemataceae cyanobacterium BLCC-F154]|uniref:NB-ARC domain-containing protein n=1 Tax=Floridaenema fluviatile BLCC-F154 TaxID=3153640 RepID=A0ABV4YHI4_9CYAN
MRADEFTEKWQSLTAKPRSVLMLLLEGKSDEEIANSVDAKLPTIRKHIQMLCDRFEIPREIDSIKRNRREDLMALFASHKPELVSQNIAPSRDKLALASKQPPISQTPQVQQNWGNAPDVSVFYDRQAELATLKQWIVDNQCRLVAILGIGGIGKTALATKLAQEIQDDFEYLIWQSLHKPRSLKQLITELIQFISGQAKPDVANDEEEIISQLIQFFKQHRCLIILDSLEFILKNQEFAGFYQDNYQNYGKFFQRLGTEPHQSCLLTTSRDKSREIALLSGENSPVRDLSLEGLQLEAAKEILREKGLTGENYWNQLIKYYQGNPLALKMIATRIKDLLQGDVEAFFKQGLSLLTLDFEMFLEEQFARLSELETAIIYQLAIGDEPIAIPWLLEHTWWRESPEQIQNAIESLLRRSLIETTSNGLTTQRVVMEYVNKRLIAEIIDEISQIEQNKTTQGIKILKIHKLEKYHHSPQPEKTVTSAMIPALKKRLSKSGINENDFREQLQRILSILATESNPEVERIAENLNYLAKKL